MKTNFNTPPGTSLFFNQCDQARQITERIARITQASFGLAVFFGYGSKMTSLLGIKGLNLTKAAGYAGDFRMFIFAFELPITLVRLKNKEIIGEFWKTEGSKNQDEMARQFVCGTACIILDAALLASFWGDQLPRMISLFTGKVPNLPNFPSANFLDRALSPALTTVYITSLMGCWKSLGEKKDSKTRLKLEKGIADLTQHLFPLVLGVFGKAQKDLLNLSTGIIGSYVLWETFPS